MQLVLIIKFKCQLKYINKNKLIVLTLFSSNLIKATPVLYNKLLEIKIQVDLNIGHFVFI